MASTDIDQSDSVVAGPAEDGAAPLLQTRKRGEEE